ncbi:MAG: MobF family relaxase [Nocardioides sp.]
MTVSLRRMSAGRGYQYLLRSVVSGDGNRSLTTPLTRYYSEAGTPPGRWLGSGLHALGGDLKPGMEVTEAQLALLIGMGRDPVTGEQLGRAYPTYKSLGERIRERVDALDPEMTLEDCADETARIEAEEAAGGVRQAVAGFDLTFSVPKSVSVLWGVADAATQERIAEAHHAAVADVLAFFEREVAATRAGVSDGDGAVAQVDVAGVAAVAYDHYDSRAGDPQLHTHVVVSNKVLTPMDGRWRSLDGRPVFASVTALSAHYNAVLADRLTRELGVRWEMRQRGPDRNPQWEVVGVSEELIREFSSRSREIEIAKDRLIADYLAAHGRMPSERTIVELRAQATLETRPPKEIRSLADLTEEWRARASRSLGTDAPRWAASVVGVDLVRPMRADDIPLPLIERIGGAVVEQVSIKRSTWSHWNLMAEASRLTMHLRFESAEDREAIVGMVIDAAQLQSVSLTPPELALSPEAFTRADGTSVFRPKHSVKYSSHDVLAAEDRLLNQSEAVTAPTVSPLIVDRVLRRVQKLSREQGAAVASIATSGRQLDLLVGPAGAGKTTTMLALRRTWSAEHGQGSVVGLAPSANAAENLADELGITCDNTAKWLHEHERGNTAYQLRAGQLVIVDEATLAGTTTLDRLSTIAAQAGAKMLLIGDAYQLSSVDAGGAFSLLASRRAEAPELTEIHRFKHGWEKEASLALRRGDTEVIGTYARKQRIHEGDTDHMLDAAYEAWRADSAAGRASVLVTESAHAVRALNERARAERLMIDGAEDGREVCLAGDVRASVGDLVITRHNDRTLVAKPGGWVKNGDCWRITDVRGDGSVVVRAVGARRRTVLPAAYVGEHLDLGYAITAHRAQGVTVDTAHVVVTASTTRENLYVSMTRGRQFNIAYVALDQPDDSHSTPEPDDVTARTVLYGVLQHKGANLSAHQTIGAEQEEYGGIGRLAAELETIAADAQHDRFVELLARSGLTPTQHEALTASTAFGPLSAALRRAEAYHHDLEMVVPRIVAQHTLDDADDIAAVLTHRLTKTTAQTPRGLRRQPHLIAGLIPEPLGPLDEDDRQAITQRAALIETRAGALAEQAMADREPWTRRLSVSQPGSADQENRMAGLSTIAAYRDRYCVTSDLPVGGGADSDAQRADRERALQALRRAEQLRGESPQPGWAVSVEAQALAAP